MKNTTESQTGSRFAVPVAVQIVVGVLLLTLAMLWHNRYRSFKPVSSRLSAATLPQAAIPFTPPPTAA